jgi:hypothetical protein
MTSSPMRSRSATRVRARTGTGNSPDGVGWPTAGARASLARKPKAPSRAKTLRPPLPCPRARPRSARKTGCARFSRSRNANARHYRARRDRSRDSGGLLLVRGCSWVHDSTRAQASAKRPGARSQRRQTSMTIRTLVDQHPTMRRANAALRQALARPTITVTTDGPIGVETRRDRPGSRPEAVPRRRPLLVRDEVSRIDCLHPRPDRMPAGRPNALLPTEPSDHLMQGVGPVGLETSPLSNSSPWLQEFQCFG